MERVLRPVGQRVGEIGCRRADPVFHDRFEQHRGSDFIVCREAGRSRHLFQDRDEPRLIPHGRSQVVKVFLEGVVEEVKSVERDGRLLHYGCQ